MGPRVGATHCWKWPVLNEVRGLWEGKESCYQYRFVGTGRWSGWVRGTVSVRTAGNWDIGSMGWCYGSVERRPGIALRLPNG